MPSETDLRDLLRGAEPEGRSAIDLDAVLSRARRRRRPRVIAAQALGSVALAGVLVTAVGFSLPRTEQNAALSAQDTSAGTEEGLNSPFADQDALKIAPDSCGAPTVDRDAGAGARLEIAPLALPTGAEPVTVTVTLRNDSGERLQGITGAPYLTLSRDGIVVWHDQLYARLLSGIIVDLAPGESMELTATLIPVACGSDADLTTSSDPAALPPAPPGDYSLSAYITLLPGDFVSGTTPPSAEPRSDVVISGPPVAVEIG